MPNTWNLKLPVNDSDLKKLQLGDVVYLSGPVFTGRSRVHSRVVDEGMVPPAELFCTNAMYHTGPIGKKRGDKWEIVCANPTNSARFQYWIEDFVEKMNLKIMVGEGGLPGKAEVCKKNGCVYLVAAGSWAGAMYADQIKKISNVFWSELDLPEAAWLMEVENFGPTIVEVDTSGNSIYDSRAASLQDRLNRSRQLLAVENVEFGLF